MVSIDYRLCPETPLPELVADVCDGKMHLQTSEQPPLSALIVVGSTVQLRRYVLNGHPFYVMQPWPGSENPGPHYLAPTPPESSRPEAPPVATSPSASASRPSQSLASSQYMATGILSAHGTRAHRHTHGMLYRVSMVDRSTQRLRPGQRSRVTQLLTLLSARVMGAQSKLQ